jgi:hypothetical protein
MSKWATFLKIARTVGPVALQFTPLAAIAGPVSIAIGEAQQIEGASGQEKLAHVTAIALTAANVTNERAGHQVIDPAVVSATAASAISAAVGAIKIVHDAHQAAPAA